MDKMAAGRDPFHRAYCGVREQLAKAERPPGSQIRVDETAQGFSISPTPMREALARLAGERLICGCRRHGYFVPRYGGADLIQLFQLSELYLLAALRSRREPASPYPIEPRHQDDGDEQRSLARAFMAILAQAESTFLLDAGALLIERLATARKAETSIKDSRLEIIGVVEQLRREGLDGQVKAIRAYHRIRRKLAERIAVQFGSRADEYIPDMV